jgi:hypothetical protein
MNQSTKWTKFPSVSRTGKFFYNSGRRSILQDWSSGQWQLAENGKLSQCFDTAKQAMKFAETNVVH